MTPRALLTDLDRTLTGPDLRLDPRVPPAMDRLRARGVVVVVVTGRGIDFLRAHGLHAACHGLVGENGAHLVVDGGEEVHVEDFRARAEAALGELAASLTWGRVLGSGPRKLSRDVAEALARAGLEHNLAFNADELMILPPRVDKASGALRALGSLGIPPEDAWAVGDGDNDAVLFRLVGRGFAVANASEAAREAADEVLPLGYADGFLHLVDRILEGAPDVVSGSARTPWRGTRR